MRRNKKSTRTRGEKSTKRSHTNSKATSPVNIGLLYILPVILTILGLFFIFEASSITTFREFGDSFYYLRQQTIWFVLGIGVMTFFSVFDYKKLYYLSFPALLITLILLILVLIPGIGTSVYGARRWINLGFFSLQPTEIAKFSVILYLSSWFLVTKRQRFFHFLGLLGGIIGLIMIQPDLGTSIIIFALFMTIYFISGESLVYIAMLSPVAIGGIIFLIATSPYRMKRLLAFMDPSVDPEGISYHIRQILISLSSGGFFGRGLANSRQKYQFLPEAHTDSIFAIIGEEIGFVGGAIFIILYMYLLFLIYNVATQTKERFGYLLVGAILTLLSMQAIINLGGMVNLLPLTGVPLPFVSYGGSSLLIFYALIGIVINVARQK